MGETRLAAYGDIDLSKGEEFEMAKVQLDSFIDRNPIALYFDVLGKPEDEEKAEAIVNEIKAYAKKCYKSMSEDEIYCTFSID